MREDGLCRTNGPIVLPVVLVLLLTIPVYAQPAGLAPGDWIKVEARQVAGLSGRYQANEDGIIDFPVVGSLQAKGISLQALRDQLQQALVEKGYQRPVELEVEALPPGSERAPVVAAQGSRPLQTGDVLGIEVAGEPTISGQYTVQPPGMIILPMAGEIQVSGLTAPELAGVLTRRLERYVVEPMVRVTLVSGIPRLVHIVGYVSRPGLYPFDQAPTVLALLAAAGGVSPMGDLASAVLYRDGKPRKLAPEGLLAGDMLPEDLLLKQGDTLVIPEQTVNAVLVVGAVQRPGAVPLQKANNIAHTILLSGGPTDAADLAQAYILRGDECIEVNLKGLMGDVPESEQLWGSQISLQADDVIVVPSSTGRDPIYVAGRVTNPGAYPSAQAKTMLSLWSLVGSALPDANLRNCTILRDEETISVDIEALVNQGDMSQNVALEPGDKVIVPEILERVYVLGQVARPGSYPIKEGETLMDILGKVGGTTILADIGKIALMRRNPPEAGRGARAARPGGVEPPRQEEAYGKRDAQQPDFGIEGMMKHRPRGEEPRPPRPEKERLGPEQQISLQILASADWEDITLRPQPGDVIYVPAKEVGLTRRDYQRMLFGIGTALLIGRSIW